MLLLRQNQLLLITIIIIFFYVYKVKCDNNYFCNLNGTIDDCQCNIDIVNRFNNYQIYPRLKSLLIKDYFRFYHINLKNKCPFWINNDGKCTNKYCHIEPCTNINDKIKKIDQNTCYNNNKNQNLDYLNRTISEKNLNNLKNWLIYDSEQDNYCVIDDNDNDSIYVDLLLNPERFTGYKGESAQKIWNAIYLENCFRPKFYNYNSYIPLDKLNNMCLEKRTYYRAISGLHASINIHLSSNYLITNDLSLTKPYGEWGMNLDEFIRRFSPDSTNGEGPNWLRNLYFIYLVELKALAKAANFLENELFYTGYDEEDWDTQMAVKDLLKLIKQFPHHFNENTMFNENDSSSRLKTQFREHFRNVTRIMDCVDCDKCKLWGKLQTHGMGTAFKILFTNYNNTNSKSEENNKKFQLKRNEIVALFNAFGRLSNSIYKLDDFHQLMKMK